MSEDEQRHKQGNEKVPSRSPVRTASDAMATGKKQTPTDIYPDGSVIGPRGERYPLTYAHWWATNSRGEQLIDLPTDATTDLPETVTGCTLHVRNSSGNTVVTGTILKMTQSLGKLGMTTLIVKATDSVECTTSPTPETATSK